MAMKELGANAETPVSMFLLRRGRLTTEGRSNGVPTRRFVEQSVSSPAAGLSFIGRSAPAVWRNAVTTGSRDRCAVASITTTTGRNEGDLCNAHSFVGRWESALLEKAQHGTRTYTVSEWRDSLGRKRPEAASVNHSEKSTSLYLLLGFQC